MVGVGEGRLWYADTLTKKYLRNAYTRRGLTCPEIAAEVGVDQTTVHRYLHRYGIPLRSSGTRATHRDGYLRPADRLTKRYLTGAVSRRQLSIAQVAEETGFAWVTVQHYMRIHGIELATPQGAKRCDVDRDELARLVGEGMSFAKIAEKLRCSATSVARRVYEWGLSEPRTPKKVDREELARLVSAGLSFAKIGEKLGCSEQTVARRTYKWGLSEPRAPR